MSLLTEEELLEIFEKDLPRDDSKDNSIFAGLLIIRKYIPGAGIEAADHDIVFSVGADNLLEAGLTNEDAENLAKLDWMIDEDSLAHFC